MRKQDTKGRCLEILRGAFNVVVVVLLLSCVAFLSLAHIRMTKRLNAIDDKMDAFEQKLQKRFPTKQDNKNRDGRLHANGMLVREKRALAFSLESIEKRLKVLESR